MRVQILNPVSDGPTQDWIIRGAASTAYSAVAKDSGTSVYISSATVADLASFECGNGSVPELGFVPQVSLNYIIKPTGSGGSAELAVGIFRNGSALDTTSHTVTTDDQINSAIRLLVDPSTSARFISSGLEDLECRFEVVSVMTGGEWRIYETWIEVEWVAVPSFYDPVSHSGTPDTITGYLDWSTTGSESAAVSSNRLVLTDSDTSDWREYSRSIEAYPSDFTSELTTRFSLTTAMSGPAFVYRIARLDDGGKDTDLCAFLDSSGSKYIGISGGSLDRDDPSKYKATYALDWTESHHVRLLVDRDSNPGASQNVKVYVDHDDTPVIDILYSDMESSGSTEISFGTGNASLTTAEVTAKVDFFSWWHFRSQGNSFQGWWDEYTGGSSVKINSSDSYIATRQVIAPPGITVGESDYCCELFMDLSSEVAAVVNYWPVLDSAGTYDLTLDHRNDIIGVTDAVIVQRTSDYYYWNSATSSWQSSLSQTSISANTSRTRSTLISNIQTSTPDNLIIKIRTDPSGRSATHSLFLYRVHLED